MMKQPWNSGQEGASRLALGLLLVLFVGSGCAALVYEIVWFQLLQLVIGSSAVSLGVLLGTFMGGMCLGSLLLPRLVSPRWHPLRVYAVLEAGIGLIGVILLNAIPAIGWHYAEVAGPGFLGILVRAAVCAVCLLPPTVLMGATLPAIARWMESTPQGVSRLGFFYGANIAGAVFGCLLAGFYLLRVYDIPTATYVAAGINAAIALLGLVLSTAAAYQANVPTGAVGSAASRQRAERAPSAWTVYVAIALSGMSALGAEVVWTRQLSLLLGATVYTFSIILAVFLVGLGIGSAAGSALASRLRSSRLALGWCQMLLTLAISWTAVMLARSLPYWPIDPTRAISPWFTFQLDLLRCGWAVLPAACLWGASFPLALGAAAARGQDAGKLVGGVYAANTVGAIVGAIGFSMLVIGWVGTQKAQQGLIAISALSAAITFAPLIWQAWRRRFPAAAADDAKKGEAAGDTAVEAAGSTSGRAPITSAASHASPVGMFSAAALTALAIISSAMLITVPEPPPGLIAYGRYLATWVGGEPEYLDVREGMNASIAVSEVWGTGARNFHVSGKVVASSEPQDMRLQRMLGHLPALLHARPRSVLVVGCGAGVTAGSFVLHPEVEKIVICEIEPEIPPAAREYFGYENNYVLDDPRVTVVLDDARHYILTTDEKFDIITSDPIHPWVKGAAALYSQEYFQLCKRHLNPGGVVTQWVPLYESNMEAVKSEVATFLDVFPGGTIWSNDDRGNGYDVVLLGQAGDTKIDVDALQQRLDRDDYQFVKASLEEIQLGSALALLKTYAGQGSDLKQWLADAEINRDHNLRLQYLAGMGLNSIQETNIFDSLVEHRRYPENLFVSNDSGLRGRALRAVFALPRSRN